MQRFSTFFFFFSAAYRFSSWDCPSLGKFQRPSVMLGKSLSAHAQPRTSQESVVFFFPLIYLCHKSSCHLYKKLILLRGIRWKNACLFCKSWRGITRLRNHLKNKSSLRLQFHEKLNLMNLIPFLFGCYGYLSAFFHFRQKKKVISQGDILLISFFLQWRLTPHAFHTIEELNCPS